MLTPLTPLGTELADELFVYDDSTGPVLLAGGGYCRSSGPGTYLARWRPGTICAADFDGNCTLDVMDFVALQNLFAAGDPAADFDGDGEFTILDFLAFQNGFDLG